MGLASGNRSHRAATGAPVTTQFAPWRRAALLRRFSDAIVGEAVDAALCATARSSTVSMSNSTPGSSSSTAAVGIARQQPPRALVALEHHELGEQLGAEADRAARAARGAARTRWAAGRGPSATARRLLGLARAACRPGNTSQPVALGRAMDTPGRDRVAHTPRRVCARSVDDDHVLGRDQALRLVDQGLGDDEHDRHLGGDGIAQGAHENAVTAELLAELVARPAISAPCASGQHDDGRFIFHEAHGAVSFPEADRALNGYVPQESLPNPFYSSGTFT